jgi:hypothetical protein
MAVGKFAIDSHDVFFVGFATRVIFVVLAALLFG